MCVVTLEGRPHQAHGARAGRKANAIEMTGREMSGKQDQRIQS